MTAKSWNHNIRYHDVVLNAVPANCGRALDVGCGQGLLARRLAERCNEVVAIDVDAGALARAAENNAGPRISFRRADVMGDGLSDASFDLIAAVATLHHLPLRPALARFRALLKPGGVLAIVGLYRLSTPTDYVVAAAALPASRLLRLLRGEADVGAPLQDAKETRREIRDACAAILPGAKVRRRLFFRYSAIWRKP